MLIGITNDGAHVGQIIYEHLREKGLNVAMESLTRADSPCSVRRCAVFVPVLTPEFEQIPVCRAAFEEARRLQKSIVPTIATKNWRPDGWIGLIIAASTFFRIFDQDNAYKQFFDSNRITDLTVEVQVSSKHEHPKRSTLCTFPALDNSLVVNRVRVLPSASREKQRCCEARSSSAKRTCKGGLLRAKHAPMIRSLIGSQCAFRSLSQARACVSIISITKSQE